ncbi:opioid growth factor receptor-like protein 1 [Ambystoma mexicanum]|uniref:opioid growth factor receptor-like protein 1 n=1 Tax=Ambystoma mexicanum TaxID=8296 RepID=UPI0037E894BE
MGNFFGGVSQKEPTALEECDSTWETDSGGEEEDEEPASRKSQCNTEQEEQDDPEAKEQDEGTEADPGAEQSEIKPEQITKPKRSFYAARDLYKYRHQYQQTFKDLRGQNDLCNLRFYLNKIPLKPDGVYIEEILNKWKGDYDKLEHNHTYIQWLFPLREQGLNFYAKELTTYEIEEFKKTKEAIKKFLLAYKMMLEFFGIKLMDKIGNVTRAANWQERFQHLNESQHNYLRITRILKSLGELGYESFKSPLVKIFLHEALVENTIPNIKQSALEYFVYTIRDRRERRKLLRFAGRHYHPPEHFVWGPPSKTELEECKPLPKPCSPSAPKNQIFVNKRSKCTPKYSPTAKTPCHLGTSTQRENKENAINDSPRTQTNCEVATQSNSTIQDETENQDCEPKEIKESLNRLESNSEALKTDPDLEAVNQECEHPEMTDNNNYVANTECLAPMDLSPVGEAAQLSGQVLAGDPRSS